MKYVRTKNGITTSDTATHELTEHICCAGYLRTLEKGASVRIGREWWNFYGSWVDIIDENGTHYSIRPDEVKNVTKELPHADTVEELCDKFVVISTTGNHIEREIYNDFDSELFTNLKCKASGFEVYGAIWTTGEHGEPILKSVVKMNEKGELELL